MASSNRFQTEILDLYDFIAGCKTQFPCESFPAVTIKASWEELALDGTHIVTDEEMEELGGINAF